MVRIITFNCHKGLNRNLEFNMVEQAVFLRNLKPDIVMLQEVTGKTNASGQKDLLEYLSFTTGLRNKAFGRTMDNDGGPFGNAIISRFPLSHIRKVIVMKPSIFTTTQDRGIVRATVELDGILHHVYCTHYTTWPDYQKNQTLALSQLMSENPKIPVIIGMDANMSFQDPILAPIATILTDSFEFFQRPIVRPEDDNIDHLLFTRNLHLPVLEYTDVPTKNESNVGKTITDHWSAPLLIMGNPEKEDGQSWKVTCAHRKSKRAKKIMYFSGKDQNNKDWLLSYDDVIKSMKKGDEYTLQGKKLKLCTLKLKDKTVVRYIRANADDSKDNNLRSLKCCN
jgi:endonuclease/exonuclease/phosphatase family metal-dependent hydrolase